MGGNQQLLLVEADTGSEELILPSDCDPATLLTDAQLQTCLASGTYNPSASSTHHDIGHGNTITYGSGPASFQYYTDDVSISGTSESLTYYDRLLLSLENELTLILGMKVQSLQLGVTPSLPLAYGVCGLGFGQYYPNIIDQLYTAGYTLGRSFGMSLQPSDGSIVFGGVDLGQYHGTLNPVNLTSLPSNMSAQYPIELTRISITQPGGGHELVSASPIIVQPDSGCINMQLPPDVFLDLASYLQPYLGSITLQNLALNELYAIDCGILQEDGTLNLSFGDSTFDIPYRNLVVQNAAGECSLNIVAMDLAWYPYCVGLPFLWSVYMVFDQDTPAVWFAPKKHCGKSIYDFDKYGTNAADLAGMC